MRDTSQMPSPDPHNTCGPVGQTPMNPRVPCRGYRAGPVFHGQDENHTAPPEAEVRLSARLSSQIPWRRPYKGGWISSIPEALPPWSFLTTSVTSAWVMKESNPESPASTSTRECVTQD
ncbi:hypothetical protein ATANTOWER_023246 [Ataeniobius toweri]|uniref:Uncharacterized protein n=1 Tax=Ataeniobius toweri TaxID=208326 RepID=A0ABU7CIP2_9TELE|nr:hypothetical protein [Ataeniobius toweri]